MRWPWILFVIVTLFVIGLTGCARDVATVFPGPPGPGTGTIVLVFSSAASGVNVALDGVLVVDDAHTDRVEITNVPVGYVELVMTANGADKAMRLWVTAERATTVPLGAPDATPSFVKSIAGTLVSLLAYTWLR